MSDLNQCTVAGCNNPHKAKGFCESHYSRYRRHGDPLGGGTSTGEPIRFYQDVALTFEGTDCLIWPYSTVKGYGQIRVSGKMALVHRIVCESRNGAPPTPEHEAAHSCGNRACVNPRHLRWATPAENSADKIIHGTHTRGELNPRAKITEAMAVEIRVLRGVDTQVSIAKRFGLSQQTVSQIQSGKLWSFLSTQAGRI